MVHGPQFAYCPSPQGRCPQPSSSSSSSPLWAQLCFWPDPGPGGARHSSAGGSPQGQGCKVGAPSPQLCTGCRAPTPAPSPSARCLALTMASPAPAPPGAWARAGSGTSWTRCPGRGPGWAWMSCRSQVRPLGSGHTAPRLGSTPETCQRHPGGPRGARTVRCQESTSFVPGTGSSSSPLPAVSVLVLAPQPNPQRGGLPAGGGDPQLPGVPRAEARGTGAVGTRHSRVGGDGGDPGSGGTAGDTSPIPPGTREDGIGLREPGEPGPCRGQCLTLSLVLRRAGVLGQGPVHLCLPSQGAPDVRVPVPLRVLPGRAQLCLPASRR